MLNAESESLVHHWFVELFRKFNILAGIFDEGRCLSIETHLSETSHKDKLSTGEVNSFLTSSGLFITRAFGRISYFGFGKRRQLFRTCSSSMERIIWNGLKRRLIPKYQVVESPALKLRCFSVDSDAGAV